jgi:hypothetical protein
MHITDSRIAWSIESRDVVRLRPKMGLRYGNAFGGSPKNRDADHIQHASSPLFPQLRTERRRAHAAATKNSANVTTSPCSHQHQHKQGAEAMVHAAQPQARSLDREHSEHQHQPPRWQRRSQPRTTEPIWSWVRMPALKYPMRVMAIMMSRHDRMVSHTRHLVPEEGGGVNTTGATQHSGRAGGMQHSERAGGNTVDVQRPGRRKVRGPCACEGFTRKCQTGCSTTS